MKKPYTRPTVATDRVFATLSYGSGCTYYTIADAACDSDSVEGAQLMSGD